MLHVNIRSLQKHFDSLNELLQELPILPQIIVISETQIKKLPLINISPPNYTFLHTDSTTSAGGIGIYIANDLSFSLIGVNQLGINGCEDIWILLDSTNNNHCSYNLSPSK